MARRLAAAWPSPSRGLLARAADRGFAMLGLRAAELVVHYRPIVCRCAGTDLHCVEALVRWQRPGRYPVGAHELLATDPRLIAWVLQEGCGQLAAWDAADPAPALTLAVDVSPSGLDGDALAPMVAAALAEHRLDAGRLCLEVGASADPMGLRALHDLGVRLAVDAPLAAPETPRIRVFLCDDAPALRHLLRTYLERGDDVVVVGEAGDGEGLTEAVLAARADLLLLDLAMPRVDGLEALPLLRAAAPGLGIIVLSGFGAERMAAKALALGADRYLEKAAGMEDVRAAVREVAAARRATPVLREAS